MQRACRGLLRSHRPQRPVAVFEAVGWRAVKNASQFAAAWHLRLRRCVRGIHRVLLKQRDQVVAKGTVYLVMGVSPEKHVAVNFIATIPFLRSREGSPIPGGGRDRG